MRCTASGKHRWDVGWAAIDTASGNGSSIAQRMIDVLPFEHEPGTEMSSLSLEIYGMTSPSPTRVQRDEEFPFPPPIQMVLGWPTLAMEQLGWCWYSSWAGMNAIEPCDAPMPSGPRADFDCFLDHIVLTP